MPFIMRLRSPFSLRSIDSTISSTGLAAPRAGRESAEFLGFVDAIFLDVLFFFSLFFFLVLEPRLFLPLLDEVDTTEANPNGRSM
jgi:hypothetical protein